MATNQPHSASTFQGTLKQLATKLEGKQVILVQGAGGNLGLEIVKCLKSKLGDSDKFTILAGLSHQDEASKFQTLPGVELIHLDLNNKELVENAFTLKIHKLVIIPPFNSNRINLVNRMTDIAHHSGVKQMVLISAIGAHSEANDYFRDLKRIQNKIRSYQEDYNWTFIGTSVHMDTIKGLAPHIKQGTVPIPLAAAKFPPIWSRDIATFVTRTLLEGGFERQALDITGPELLSGTDLAQIFSSQLGKKLEYVAVTSNEFRTLAVQCGMNPMKAESVKDMFDWYTSGQGNRTTNEYERVVGTKPATFTTFLKENLSFFK